MLRLLIPLALVATVLLAAATAPAHHAKNTTVKQSACVHSERQLASAACRR